MQREEGEVGTGRESRCRIPKQKTKLWGLGEEAAILRETTSSPRDTRGGSVGWFQTLPGGGARAE